MGDYRYFPDQPAPPQGYDGRGQRPAPAWHDPRHAPEAPAAFIRHPRAPAPQPRAPYAADVPPSPPLRRPAPAAPVWADHDGYSAQDYAPPYAPAPEPAYAPAPAPQPVFAAPPRVAAPDWGPDHPSAPPAWVGPQAQARQSAPQTSSTPPVQAATVLHGLGAVMSLGLVVLAAGWTWNMMQRDVSGVPVVRALEGPMRVAPENPGGQQAAYQGLAVNQLAANGQSGESEMIVLAPPPVGLPDAVAPSMADPNLVTQAAANEIPSELGFRTPNRLAVERSPVPRGRDQASVPIAQIAAAAAAAMPVAPALSTSNDPSAAESLAASVAQSVAVGLAGTGGRDIDPATIGPGSRLVQLGAFDSPDEARAAWDALTRRFNPLLSERGRVIEAAHSGGSVFYRLRAHGFSDERDARRFCAALVAEQIDCIPVLVR